MEKKRLSHNEATLRQTRFQTLMGATANVIALISITLSLHIASKNDEDGSEIKRINKVNSCMQIYTVLKEANGDIKFINYAMDKSCLNIPEIRKMIKAGEFTEMLRHRGIPHY